MSAVGQGEDAFLPSLPSSAARRAACRVLSEDLLAVAWCVTMMAVGIVCLCAVHRLCGDVRRAAAFLGVLCCQCFGLRRHPRAPKGPGPSYFELSSINLFHDVQKAWHRVATIEDSGVCTSVGCTCILSTIPYAPVFPVAQWTHLGVRKERA